MSIPVIDRQKSIEECCQELFNAAYDRVKQDIPFKREWSNGTGLYDFAVYGAHAPTITPGSIFKSVTPGGRKLLLIGTRLGNVIIFERQVSNNKSSIPSYCYQSTSNFTQGGWFSDMELDDYDMALAVGDEKEFHIGRRIDLLHTAMKRSS